jgi:phospholipase C
LEYSWDKAADGAYNIAIHGPNGYYQKLVSRGGVEPLKIKISYSAKSNLLIYIESISSKSKEIIVQNAYTKRNQTVSLKPYKSTTIEINTQDFGRWYDVTLKVEGWQRQYAGRMENGKPSISDPLMA